MSHKTRLENLLDYYQEDPEDTFTIYAIALEYLNASDYANSEKFFADLIRQHKNYLPAYYHFGKMYEKADNRAKAGETYLMGIRLAESKQDFHTLRELKEAYHSLMNIEDDDW